MNLKTWAKEKGCSLQEAKEITGLTHWNQSVVETESTVEVETESKEAKVHVTIETEANEVYDLKLIETSIRGAGTKSPYWQLRHLVGK